MAITKIHPIEKTLYLALDYIMKIKQMKKFSFLLLLAIQKQLILNLNRQKENVIPKQKS